QRVVAIADVRVGEQEHALRERDLVLHPDAFREIEQALVAQEALVADLEAGQAPAIEVEEAHVVQDGAAPDPRSEQAQPGPADLGEEREAIVGEGEGEEAEAQRLAEADLVQGLHAVPRRSARRKATSLPK